MKLTRVLSSAAAASHSRVAPLCTPTFTTSPLRCLHSIPSSASPVVSSHPFLQPALRSSHPCAVVAGLDSAMLQPPAHFRLRPASQRHTLSLFTLLTSASLPPHTPLSLSSPLSAPPPPPPSVLPVPAPSPLSELPVVDCPSPASAFEPLSCHLTYRPNVLKRKRTHGFLARKGTRGGKRVLNRRWIKGRKRMAA